MPVLYAIVAIALMFMTGTAISRAVTTPTLKPTITPPLVIQISPTDQISTTLKQEPISTPSPTSIPSSTPYPTLKPKVTTAPTLYIAPTNPPTSTSNTKSGGSWVCDCSKPCTAISSCAEAQYQLNTCGCRARDNDKDGTACDGAPLHCQN